MNRVLVTGAHGFLGRNTTSLLKKRGYEVVGIGHGHWGFEKPDDFGIDEWIEGDIDLVDLSQISGKINCVIHCAGGSSVGHSVEYPLQEFQRTVNSTVNILEFIRTKHPGAKLIYPSSAAVYGNQSDVQISEKAKCAPISPYGCYKKIVEDLCESYSRNFDIQVTIVRFFSIYGAGLKKQLLWDACNKLCSGRDIAKFYGTGRETRDWIHVKDAAKLFYHLLKETPSNFEVFNGGSGKKKTVSEILFLLAREIDTSVKIHMGNENKDGDPMYYWADISKIEKFGWTPRCKIADGVNEYVQWFMGQKKS